MIKHIPGYKFELESETTESGRHYFVDGEAYPSVTTILNDSTPDAVIKWREAIGEAKADELTKLAAARGSEVHDMVETYLNNQEVQFGDYAETNVKLYRTIRRYLQHIDNVYCVEDCLYSKLLKIAGRVDCIGEYNNILSIIDIKTASRPRSSDQILNYYMQTAAYALMFEEMYGIKITQAVIIMAVENNLPMLFVVELEQYKYLLVEKALNYYDKQE